VHNLHIITLYKL